MINSDSDEDIVILSHTLANAVDSAMQLDIEIQGIDLVESEDSDDERCNWNGETTHCVGHYTDSDWEMVPDSGNDGGGEESDDDIEELEGDELKESLESAISAVEQLWLDIGGMELEMDADAASPNTTVNVQDILMQSRSKAIWEAAESKQNLGYNGHSSRSQRRKEKDSQDAKEEREHSAQRFASFPGFFE